MAGARGEGKDKKGGRLSTYGWSFSVGPEETKATSSEETAGPVSSP